MIEATPYTKSDCTETRDDNDNNNHNNDNNIIIINATASRNYRYLAT